MKWSLYAFELWSGLKINFHKSSLVLMGTSDIRLALTARILNY